MTAATVARKTIAKPATVPAKRVRKVAAPKGVSLVRNAPKRLTVRMLDQDTRLVRTLMNYAELIDVPTVATRHDEDGEVIVNDFGRPITLRNRTAAFAQTRIDEIIATF